MSEQIAVRRKADRADELREVFESVTGTTIVIESQQEQIPHFASNETTVHQHLEAYLEDTMGEDGLAEAIDDPEFG